MFAIGSDGFGSLSPTLFVQFSCEWKANNRHSGQSTPHSHHWHQIAGTHWTPLLLIEMYKCALWHFTCRFAAAHFFLFPSNSKSAKVDKVSAGVRVVMLQCVLCGHISARLAYIRLDAAGCQQLNRPGFEGAVLYGLSPAMSANVFECLASRRLIQSSLLSPSSSTRWQRTSCSRRQRREEVTSSCGDGEGSVGTVTMHLYKIRRFFHHHLKCLRDTFVELQLL